MQQHRGRQGFAHFNNFGFGGACHIQRVGFGLFYDTDTNAALAVATVFGALVFRRNFNVCHFTQADQVAVTALPQNKGSKVFRRVVITFNAHGKFTRGGLHTTCGQLDVF